MSSTSEYLVGPKIGQGSFAHVVYGRHKATDREVAVKVMDQVSIKKRPVLLHAVWTERRLLQQLQDSPWVVNLYASFYDTISVYLVMELATCGDLEGFITTQGWLVHVHPMNRREQQTVDTDLFSCYTPCLASQIIEAVESLHTQYGILHCDLKPSNILLKEDSRASTNGCRLKILLADFACAVELSGENGREDLTEEEQSPPRGTCEYASPEIVRGSPPSQLTVASDYWSVGCILYAMLHRGNSPFHQQDWSEAQIIHSIISHGMKDTIPPSDMKVDDTSENEGSQRRMICPQSGISGVVQNSHATSDEESESCFLDGTVPAKLPLNRPSDWVSPMSAGLIQADTADRMKAWRTNLCHRYMNGCETDCEKKGANELPVPSWRNDVNNANLLDGTLGWSAFEAIT